MEGKHSLLKLRAQHKRRATGQFISLTLRLAEIRDRLALEGGFAEQFRSCWQACRSAANVASVLGLSHHPLVQKVRAMKWSSVGSEDLNRSALSETLDDIRDINCLFTFRPPHCGDDPR